MHERNKVPVTINIFIFELLLNKLIVFNNLQKMDDQNTHFKMGREKLYGKFDAWI